MQSSSLKSSIHVNDSDSSLSDSTSDQCLYNNNSRMLFYQQPQQMSIIQEDLRESSVNGSTLHFQQRMGSFDVVQSANQQMIDANIKRIIQIQTFFKRRLCMQSYKNNKKWATYRRYVIQELIETEKLYVQDLGLIINQIIIPIQQQNLLEELEIQHMFRNIEQIHALNNQFLGQITELFMHYHPNQLYGKIFEKYVQFFKIYFEYTSNFNIEEVAYQRKINIRFNEFITETENNDIYRGLNLEAFLIKPVQRLPKYVLLLKDLLKHTWKEHPDYMNMKRSLELFIEVNKQINNMIDRFLKNQTLFDLQRQYFDEINMQIIESSREYVQSETLNLLVSKASQKSVIVYICSDMLIITERIYNPLIGTHERLDSYLYLDAQSFCKRINETVYYRCMFSVCGKDKSVTFVCQNKKQKESLIVLMESLISELQSQVNRQQSSQDISHKCHPIRVYAKGTEVRSSFLKKHTVYVMLLNVGKYTLTLSTRYRNLTQLEEIAKKDFPDIHLPHLSRTEWMRNQNTQIIEARKILIENFLETLLNSRQVRMEPQKILKFLELPPSFYEMATISDGEEVSQFTIQFNQSQPLAISSEIRTRTNEDLNSPLVATGSTSLQGSRSITNWIEGSNSNSSTNTSQNLHTSISLVLNQTRNSSSYRSTVHHKSLLMNGDGKQVKIKLMDGQIVHVQATEETRVVDMIQAVAEQIKLQCFDDFKLSLTDGKEIRILDDEDSFPQVHCQQDKKQQNNNIIGKIALFFNEKQRDLMQLVLKKHIFLKDEKERVDYMHDPVRLRLICAQSFKDIYHEHYYFTFNNLSKMAAYYLLIKYQDAAQMTYTKQSLPIDKVKELIPPKVYKSIKEQQWVQQIFDDLCKLKDQMAKILTNPTEMKQYNCYSDKELSLKEQRLKYQYLASVLFLQSITTHYMYGLQTFFVEVPQQTKDLIQIHFNVVLQNNIYLAINYNSLILLSPSDKHQLLRIHLDSMLEPQFYPFTIGFKQNTFKDTLHFKTTHGLEIQKLYLTYRKILEITQLPKNQ